MNNGVCIISQCQDFYVTIPKSVKLAILLPTVRWTSAAQSVIGAWIGGANENVAILIADNSENEEKRAFLEKICSCKPNIIAISHEKNIGGLNNFYYLYDWCKEIEYCALVADDDWVSPTYHLDAFDALQAAPNASSASVGTTFVDLGDGNLINVNQASMCGEQPIQRMMQWNCSAARVTMYNVSRRTSLDAALEFLKKSPLNGTTLLENLWELNRLAVGDFLNLPGKGCMIHYPAQRARDGKEAERVYDSLYKDHNLQAPFVYFGNLSTAIQCAIFLMGNMSPIKDPLQKVLCGQHIFSEIFKKSFLKKVDSVESHEAVRMLFANHPRARDGFFEFCVPPFSENPQFTLQLLEWFIEVIKALENPPINGVEPVSEQFKKFVLSVLSVNQPATETF